MARTPNISAHTPNLTAHATKSNLTAHTPTTLFERIYKLKIPARGDFKSYELTIFRLQKTRCQSKLKTNNNEKKQPIYIKKVVSKFEMAFF